MIYETFDSSMGALKSLSLSKSESKDHKEWRQMANKILVLMDDGQYLELTNCIIVGAIEYPEKVVYHKYLFSNCEIETRKKLLDKAEDYVKEMQKTIPQ